MPDVPILAKAMIHLGEEPPIIGKKGTGAVFFSGCTLGCSYCQNIEISQRGKGIQANDLRKTFETLIEQGAETIDLVTPSHFLPHIIEALTPKLPVPVVYNCGGYESVESIKALEGLVDVYLPDLKYSDNQLAMKLSSCNDYFGIAKEAIKEMFRQTGKYAIKNGILQKGVLIRHLVLPGCVDNSLGVVEWMSDTFQKDDVLISLMSQYVPKEKLESPFNRRITEDEYAAVESWMDFCGICNGYTQDFSSATTEYLPDFNLQGFY
jgi:putative pyruvate formate lyase activating enzyme